MELGKSKARKLIVDELRDAGPVFFFFLFIQFCDVATLSIIHEEILPCLAIDQL
jgi:hypothetical protein